MIDSILTFFVASWWIITPIAFVGVTIVYFYKKLTGEDDRSEADTNDWLTLFIFIAVVGGIYLAVADYDDEQEATVYQACIEMNAYDFSDPVELVAYCDELLEE
ncbi:hypothetical protein N9F72_03750 [Gammaproteobacteria bacterium]|nr:hypothetical protein [Gammaproteobacteria bacterium]